MLINIKFFVYFKSIGKRLMIYLKIKKAGQLDHKNQIMPMHRHKIMTKRAMNRLYRGLSYLPKRARSNGLRWFRDVSFVQREIPPSTVGGVFHVLRLKSHLQENRCM